MDGNFEKLANDFEFYNYSPFFGIGVVDINPPILERLDGWSQADTYFECRLPEMDTTLPWGSTEAYAIKIPKGNTALIKYDGIIGVYTPKVAPSLGGVANYNIGRIYPKESNIIIFESNNDELAIEQNLIEDYHHVIFKFGKEIKSKRIIEQTVQPIISEEDQDKKRRIEAMEQELRELKKGL